MPVLSPMACRPSARLTAVVDLPTPPLPEATAIMCLMPATWIAVPPAAGSRCRAAAGRAPGARLLHPGAFRHRSAPRRGAGCCRPARLLRRQHGDDALHAVHLAHDLLGGLAQGLELGRPLRRHRDREGDAAVLQQDLRHQPQVDDIALHVGPLDPAQALDDLLFAGAHLCLM